MTVFLDTNVLLRFLTQDDAAQAERAEALFRKAASGDAKLVVGPPVLFELAWTLRQAYAVPQSEVLNIMEAVCCMNGVQLLDRVLVGSAIHLGRLHAMEFADAYIAATVMSAEMDALATFNSRHFRKTDIRIIP